MIGLAFSESTAQSVRLPNSPLIDHYEVLQISPRAEFETIHRVFRIMASRFHPDNRETGNRELFRRISQAYEVLSNPQKRAEYDSVYLLRVSEPLEIFGMRDFVDDLNGENNRRLGTLCLLYNKRRNCPDRPSLSLLDLERRMSLPREYLMFTTWFLKEEGFVKTDDTSSYYITSAGAKHVESQIQACPLVQNLLAPGRQTGEQTGDQAPAADGSAFGPRDTDGKAAPHRI
jgi:curved DNA-binding protein CbpA